jgi:myosin heavy subunit
MLARAISSMIGALNVFERIQDARQTGEQLKLWPPSLLRRAADKLYTKAEIYSLVVENENLMVEQRKLVAEQDTLVVEQEALVSELANWVLKASDLVQPLSISLATKEDKQAGEDIVSLGTEQQLDLEEELRALVAKLSSLVLKQVDLAESKRKEQADEDNIRTKQLVEERVGMEREKIETEKAKLQEERESLEAEKEALKAKAAKLGIEEKKLRTTTPAEFQKLVDAQAKLYDDLDALHDKIKTPGNDTTPEEIARQVREFRLKTKDTLILMNANDKLIEDAWDILDSMGCITSDIIHKGNDTNYYWTKLVAALFADHIVEDELRVANGLHSEEGLEVNEGTKVGEAAQGLPLVREVLLEEESPKVEEVLQVGDGLQ